MEEKVLLQQLDTLRKKTQKKKDMIRSLELLELEQVISRPSNYHIETIEIEEEQESSVFEDQVDYYLRNLETLETESEEDFIHLLPSPITPNFINLILRLKLETMKKIRAIHSLTEEVNDFAPEELEYIKQQIELNRKILSLIDTYLKTPELITEAPQNKLILVPTKTGKIAPLEHLKDIPIDFYPSIASLLESIKNNTFKNVRHFYTGSISEVRDLNNKTRVLFDRLGPDTYAIIGILVKKTKQNSAYRERTAALVRNYQMNYPTIQEAMATPSFEEKRVQQEESLWQVLNRKQAKGGEVHAKTKRRSND